MEKLYERSDNTPQWKAFVQQERGQKVPNDSPMYYTGEILRVPEEGRDYPEDMKGNCYYIVGVGSSPIPRQVRFKLAEEKERRKRQQVPQIEPIPEQTEYPVIDYSDWTTTGHLKVAKFILKKDNEYLKRIMNTFADKISQGKHARHTEQVERLQDVKGLDSDDDFASYWLPKLRKSFYIMRSSKSEGKNEASTIISSAREALNIPNPNKI